MSLNQHDRDRRCLLKKCLRISLRIVAGAALLAASSYAILVGINWNDRPAGAAAQKLAKAFDAAPAPPDDKNAYVYMTGFSVEQSADPFEWGVKRIRWANLNIARSHFGEDMPGNDFVLPSAGNSSLGTLAEACREIDRSCLATLNQYEPEIPKILQENQWLQDRYETLLSLSQWRETTTLDINMQFPAYAHAFDGQKVLLLRAWSASTTGDSEKSRELLDKDLIFWRNVLASTDMLITKLIAATAIKRNFGWTNIIINRLPADQSTRAIPHSLQQTITISEYSMRRCLTGEWIFTHSILAKTKNATHNPLDLFQMDDSDNSLEPLFLSLASPLLQIQDSKNRYAEFLDALSDILEVPLEQYPHAFQQAHELESQTAEAASVWWRPYNLLGNLLWAISTPEFTPYAARVADLEGMRRATLLAIRLRNQLVTPEKAQGMLVDAAERSPYDNSPFEWDEAERAIVFNGLAPEKHAQTSFLY